MNWPEALTSLEGEILKKFLVFNYVSTLKNQTWKLETLPHLSQSIVNQKWVLEKKYHLMAINFDTRLGLLVGGLPKSKELIIMKHSC
jgi:hypothetical protein